MIRFVINIYIYVLIFDAILSFFPEVRRYPWGQSIKKVAEFTCKPVRRYLPAGMGFDISHLAVILGLKILTFLW